MVQPLIIENFAQPLFNLHVVDIVVIDLDLITNVVGQIDVNSLIYSKQRFQYF